MEFYNTYISIYFSSTFLIYLLRWIISAVVMMLPLYFLVKFECCKGKYQEYYHLVLVQIFGAFIFFNIDRLIFEG